MTTKKITEEPKIEELTSEELDQAQGGATEELFGSYNFKVEINGVSSGELKPRTSPTQFRKTK